MIERADRLQRTIASSTSLSGVGLHTGAACTVRLEPLECGQGILIRLPGLSEPFPATVDYLIESRRCTALGLDGHHVLTVEHLLSALAGCGVDNCLLVIEGGEIPVMDGSAAPFVEALEGAGIQEQSLPRRTIALSHPVWIENQGSHILAVPYDGFEISFGINFEHQWLGQQIFSAEISSELYRNEISRARTFGFMREVEELRSRGLALGGSLDNAVVIGEEGYLSQLRYENEPVRHKVLDLIGDLALLGFGLRARLTALKTSHAMHAMLVGKILQTRRN